MKFPHGNAELDTSQPIIALKVEERKFVEAQRLKEAQRGVDTLLALGGSFGYLFTCLAQESRLHNVFYWQSSSYFRLSFVFDNRYSKIVQT